MLDEFKRRIEAHLDNLIPQHSSFFPSLYEGARYVLLAPGKRIRPLLTLATTHLLGEMDQIQKALHPACALEMVHTYSLIHDDLPCMDDDDFRRGLPTLHRVYSEGHAVLIGDYLLTYAFELIADAPLLTAEQKVDLSKTLSLAAGGEGMIGGQVMDIEKSTQIDQTNSRKTAALFCAALTFGGIIANTSPAVMTLLQQFGTQFGQLFQMIDDLLDIDHLEGQEKAKERAASYYEAALQTLTLLPGNNASLKKLTELIFAQYTPTLHV